MAEDKVKQKLVSAIGTDILNQLSLNGVIEACKFYSIKLAEEHYDKLDEDEREKVLKNVIEMEAKQEEQLAAQKASTELPENMQKGAEEHKIPQGS